MLAGSLSLSIKESSWHEAGRVRRMSAAHASVGSRTASLNRERVVWAPINARNRRLPWFVKP